MKKACVIGWPVAHSRSPLIHNYWIKQYSIHGSYERIEVSPDKLVEFIRNLQANGYAGCNVTLPHKEHALQAVDQIDRAVAEMGSLNTIYLENAKICATSTDGEGFYNNLLAHVPDFDPPHANILLLGAGGSARAICQRLLRENVKKINIYNRTTQRAIELQKQLGDQISVIESNQLELTIKEATLLINTTSQGMIGQPELDISIDHLPKNSIVADIIYVPLKTKLIKTAEKLGLKTVPGLGMLLHQAVPGFTHWFGVQPSVTKDLFDLVARDIDKDYMS